MPRKEKYHPVPQRGGAGSPPRARKRHPVGSRGQKAGCRGPEAWPLVGSPGDKQGGVTLRLADFNGFVGLWVTGVSRAAWHLSCGIQAEKCCLLGVGMCHRGAAGWEGLLEHRT